MGGGGAALELMVGGGEINEDHRESPGHNLATYSRRTRQ
jgi:hypothetical protein